MRLAVVLAFMMLATGCMTLPAADMDADAPMPPADMDADAPPPVMKDEDPSLARQHTAFAFDLLRELSAERGDENLFLSPFSISVAVAMAAHGARGATFDAMTEALRLGHTDHTRLLAANAALLHALDGARDNVTLDVAHSLWLEARFDAGAQYLDDVRNGFHADLFVRDFRSDATLDEMNQWASDNTDGMIPEVVNRLSPDEVLILMNAVYFKGLWSAAFNPECTREANFTSSHGDANRVQMMCGMPAEVATFDRTNDVTTVRIPYAGDRVALYGILPPEDMALSTFVGTWTDASFEAAVERAQDAAVHVHFPRLDLKTGPLDLRPALTAMGMGLAFTEIADFTGIGNPLHLSRVEHTAALEMDEEGTRAAAATVAGIAFTSYQPGPPVVTFDRPFLLALRDDATGSVLFLGLVHDASAE